MERDGLLVYKLKYVIHHMHAKDYYQIWYIYYAILLIHNDMHTILCTYH